MPCDYSLGKIYTIRNKADDKLIYVGSTVQPLAKRWGGHKSDSNQEKRKDRILYQTIKNNWDDWFIELYENFPCKNKEELCKREGEITRQIATLNHNIAGRTQKEYQYDNADKIAEHRKIYRKNNTDRIKEKEKQFYIDNADKIKENVRMYYINNAEKINEYKKKYRIKNADKIKEKANQNFNCECGGHYTSSHKHRHLETKKHKEYLSTLQE